MPNVPPRPDRSIALVGLMGAGKTTVGRRLARRLGLPFADADEEIERAAGLSVAAIFARHGETHFRESERNAIVRLVAGPPKVIATGGGAFVDDETRRLILERCVAVWLDADLDTLAERAARRAHRPLLRGQDPRSVLAGLAERRNPLYAEAHIKVRSGAMPHGSVVGRILEALERRQ